MVTEDFDFADFMKKAESNERHEKWRRCAESVDGRHSDPDQHGKCHWCRNKIFAAAQRLFPKDPADIDIYYDYFYNPDGIT